MTKYAKLMHKCTASLYTHNNPVGKGQVTIINKVTIQNTTEGSRHSKNFNIKHCSVSESQSNKDKLKLNNEAYLKLISI